MKKALIIALTICFLSSVFAGSASAAPLTDALKGRILLQVQDKGQAWY
jgi:hypothetical protein